jgi:hypothetical protein
MTVIPMRGAHEAPKAERSRMETMLLTPEVVKHWKLPRFQRPLRVNAKVRAFAEELKMNGGIIEGVITLGQLPDDKAYYVCDGQHRLEGAKISGLPEFIADVRIRHFDSKTEMATAFVRLQDHLVTMRPDDKLRALEEGSQAMRYIRRECLFVGYESIRRGTTSPILSMSSALRCWFGSSMETPNAKGDGRSVVETAADMTMLDAEEIARFLRMARAAWGSDLEYSRLWGNLNLTICMWLWRQLVLNKERGIKRYAVLNEPQFKQCLMRVSSAPDYLDWLVGRLMSDRDRAPCYARIKAAFASRLRESGDPKPSLPQPAWTSR